MLLPNDVMALDAVQALLTMHRTDIKVMGFDASGDARAAIPRGPMLGSVAQFPSESGWLSVELALRPRRNEMLPSDVPTKVEVVSR
ncbi:MAG: hypothetical protein ACYCW6_22195 [Candidatus Xenobia bacterium]